MVILHYISIFVPFVFVLCYDGEGVLQRNVSLALITAETSTSKKNEPYGGNWDKKDCIKKFLAKKVLN